MKKTIIILLLTITFAFSLSACGLGKVQIENYEWEMRYIMHSEDEQLIVDATDTENPTHPEAKLITMKLVAKDGKIMIRDVTNNRIYEGSYTVKKKTPTGTDYRITIDGREGYATVAMTAYADGTEEPTLPITLENYSLYFYSK